MMEKSSSGMGWRGESRFSFSPLGSVLTLMDGFVCL